MRGLWGYVLGDTVTFEQRDPPLLRFSGRTRYFLSAFGEHLISEEVERGRRGGGDGDGRPWWSISTSARCFPTSPQRPGRHRYLIEFAGPGTPEVVRGRGWTGYCLPAKRGLPRPTGRAT